MFKSGPPTAPEAVDFVKWERIALSEGIALQGYLAAALLAVRCAPGQARMKRCDSMVSKKLAQFLRHLSIKKRGKYTYLGLQPNQRGHIMWKSSCGSINRCVPLTESSAATGRGSRRPSKGKGEPTAACIGLLGACHINFQVAGILPARRVYTIHSLGCRNRSVNSALLSSVPARIEAALA